MAELTRNELDKPYGRCRRSKRNVCDVRVDLGIGNDHIIFIWDLGKKERRKESGEKIIFN